MELVEPCGRLAGVARALRREGQEGLVGSTSSYRKDNELHRGTIIYFVYIDSPRVPRLCNWRLRSGFGPRKTDGAAEVVLHSISALLERVSKRAEGGVVESNVRHLQVRQGDAEVEVL